jgi:RNA polymerase sporulation-specific sigma factor
MERKVLKCYLEGKTYRDIALEMGKSVKSIDNAMQRIKRKLEILSLNKLT